MATKSTFTSRYKTLITSLVKARKEAGMTQVELADRLCRPQSFVSKYETGERRLDVIEFLEVADALHADPLEIIRKVR